jgi:hypothetical protein
VVVAGIGVLPRTQIGATAGLEVDSRIITDEYLATSPPDVYAAADVANAFHPGYGHRIRLEHWSSALNHGPVAAENMLGQHTAYDKVPDFFSDQPASACSPADGSPGLTTWCSAATVSIASSSRSPQHPQREDSHDDKTQTTARQLWSKPLA